MEITGRYYKDMGIKTVSEKFRKREFILRHSEEINGNVYVNYIKMQLVQNKCEIIDRFKVGDEIKVYFNLKGNEIYRRQEDKYEYITNIDVWRIENHEESTN